MLFVFASAVADGAAVLSWPSVDVLKVTLVSGASVAGAAASSTPVAVSAIIVYYEHLRVRRRVSCASCWDGNSRTDRQTADYHGAQAPSAGTRFAACGGRLRRF